MINCKHFIVQRFGVCCVFLNTAVGTQSITENRTRLRNSEYPSTTTATAATTATYTINKMQSGNSIKFFKSIVIYETKVVKQIIEK